MSMEAVCRPLSRKVTDEHELAKSVFSGVSVYFNYTGAARSLDVNNSDSQLGLSGWDFQVRRGPERSRVRGRGRGGSPLQSKEFLLHPTRWTLAMTHKYSSNSNYLEILKISSCLESRFGKILQFN